MGLWAQLTGQEDASKANKKAAEEQRALYEKARKEEYNATLQSSQLTNALMMSNLSDQMAGKGITDVIRADYEQKIANAENRIFANRQNLSRIQNTLNYYEGGGGKTKDRGSNLRYYRGLVSNISSDLQSQNQEIDRISGILGTIT